MWVIFVSPKSEGRDEIWAFFSRVDRFQRNAVCPHRQKREARVLEVGLHGGPDRGIETEGGSRSKRVRPRYARANLHPPR